MTNEKAKLKEERFQNMFGCGVEDMELLMNGGYFETPRLMLAMQILSDAQVQLVDDDIDTANQFINRAKYLLSAANRAQRIADDEAKYTYEVRAMETSTAKKPAIKVIYLTEQEARDDADRLLETKKYWIVQVVRVKRYQSEEKLLSQCA